MNPNTYIPYSLLRTSKYYLYDGNLESYLPAGVGSILHRYWLQLFEHIQTVLSSPIRKLQRRSVDSIHFAYMISTRAIAILLVMMQGITFWVCESYSDTSGESAVHSYRTKPNDLNNDTLQSEHTLCVQKKRPKKKRMRMFAGEKAGWLVRERAREMESRSRGRPDNDQRDKQEYWNKQRGRVVTLLTISCAATMESVRIPVAATTIINTHTPDTM